MTIDDEKQLKYQFLDFIEFSQADIEDISNNENGNLITLKKKWSNEKRNIDLEALRLLKEKCNETYSSFQENLLLFRIEKINTFSSFIPLNELFDSQIASSKSFSFAHNNEVTNYNLNAAKELLIDLKVYQVLTREKELNWVPIFNPLYPIKTLGDGNCLCHSCLSFMIGMQDLNLGLRETLKIFMNNQDYTENLRKRYFTNRREADLANSIQVDENVLDQEWQEIINMRSNNELKTSTNHNKDQHDHYENKSDKIDKKKESIKKTNLIYLEDIHIFSLANLLRRPIIVISLPTFKGIEAINMRGIYLPLLIEPNLCVKDPIVIAFHDYHFLPLLFAFDEEAFISENNSARNVNANPTSKIKYNDNYFYFENMINVDNFGSMAESSLNQAIIRKKLKEFYNFLPLVYFNQEKMKIHFLNLSPADINNNNNNNTIKNNNKEYERYLSSYLNVAEFELDQQDIDPECLYMKKNQKRTIMGCFLSKKIKKVKNDGITSYINFLNKSGKAQQKKAVNASLQSSDIILSSSFEQPFNTQKYDEESSFKGYCKYCKNEKMYDGKYYDLCYDCLRKQINQSHLTSDIKSNFFDYKTENSQRNFGQQVFDTNSSYPNKEQNNEVELRNLTFNHNSDLIINKKPIGPIQQINEQKLHKDLNNSNLNSNSSKYPIKNNTLNICRNSTCKNWIQQSIINPSNQLYCDQCIRVLNQEEKNRQEREFYKRQTVHTTSSDKSYIDYVKNTTNQPRIIEIPVTVEKSKNNNISAYDIPQRKIGSTMVQNSRLYKPSINNHPVLTSKLRNNNLNSSYENKYELSNSYGETENPYYFKEFRNINDQEGTYSRYIENINRRKRCTVCNVDYQEIKPSQESGVCQKCHHYLRTNFTLNG